MHRHNLSISTTAQVSKTHALLLILRHRQRSKHQHISAQLQYLMGFDLDACIQKLLNKQLLHETLLREICEKTKEVLMRESNVVHVQSPVTVVGDIHGWVFFLEVTIDSGSAEPHTRRRRHVFAAARKCVVQG